jgi:hypothetical protein
MSAIRIHRRVDSETLHLPELKPFIGKTVEITVTERSGTGPADRWAAAAQAARELTDYDFDAWREQRDFDRLHGHPPQP